MSDLPEYWDALEAFLEELGPVEDVVGKARKAGTAVPFDEAAQQKTFFIEGNPRLLH